MTPQERYLCLDDLFPGAGLAMATLPYEGDEDPEEDSEEAAEVTGLGIVSGKALGIL